MVIDLHAHSKGISRCCQLPAEEILNIAKETGLSGIALTNHYEKDYLENGDAAAFARCYVEEFEKACVYGRSIGLTVLFGIEVTMKRYPHVHLLIYGVDAAFLKVHNTIYDYTQKELFDAVHDFHGLLVQAHPFRNGATVMDPQYLDGLEINCHPLYGRSYREELIRIAKKEQLFLTCGGDFHADTYRPRCGTFVPDTVTDTFLLADYLKHTKEDHLLFQEVNASVVEELMLKR